MSGSWLERHIKGENIDFVKKYWKDTYRYDERPWKEEAE